MNTRNKYRKRKRTSNETVVEIISADSDNEVSFRVKRPRRSSIGSEESNGSSSNSSTDSGFKSNFSEDSHTSSAKHEGLSSSSQSKDAAVYYAKKSPAKQPPSQLQTVLPNECTTQLVFPDNSEINKSIEEETKFHLSNQCKINSNILGHKKPKNVKGLTLNVEASAKLRKVENIIELNESTKVLPRRSPNGYMLPEPVPVGIILTDLMKNRWKVGKTIGIGGFGEIYSAEKLMDEASPKCATNYVVKVEPHSNGPLFVETNFYLRATRKDLIDLWKQERGIPHLGVPHVEGSGSFQLRGKKFRFLVIPRYGTDLQTLLDQSGSTLSVATACSIAKQVVDSYEYIHSKGYVHKDCKGSNILFNSRGSTAPEVTEHTPMKKVCLIDYGLVSKYVQGGGLHKPYRIDERSAHEGTLEYTSRDAHLGCVSRRGDIEVLLYCLIEWLGGKLPWDQPQQPHPKAIHKSKIIAFKNLEKFLNEAFAETSEENKVPPPFLIRLMKYIAMLRFEEKPDYDFLRSIFAEEDGSRKSDFYSGNYSSEDEEVNLTLSIRSKHNFTPPPPISPIGRSPFDSNDDTDDEVVFKEQCPERIHTRSPRTRHMDEANIKQRIEEEILAKKAVVTEEELKRQSEERFSKEREMLYKNICIKSLQNPTPVMLQQMNKIEGRRQNFHRSTSEIKSSPFRRSKFVMVGTKRARSRSLAMYNNDNDIPPRTPKHDAKEHTTPRSLQCRKTVQRRKGVAVKRLFSPSPGMTPSIAFSTKILRRSNKSAKTSPNTSSRRRHRSGPAKESGEIIDKMGNKNIQGEANDISSSKAAMQYRRNKKVIPIIPTQDTPSGFTKHVQDFSSIFNKALSNVTKSILRYNSKS